MKLYDIIDEEKTRLDPACWTGKKIGTPKTKVKGGVRVNNCVPAESIELDEYGDTAKGQKMLGKVQKRAVDRVIQADDKNRLEPDVNKRDLKTVRKNADTADRAWDRMTDKDLDEESKGLYYNVNKRKAAGTSRPASSPKAPTAQAWKDAAKTAKKEGVAEGLNGEYDDEAGMADNNLETLRRAVDGIDNVINTGDNLPEWCQEKIAVAKSMLVTVWDYMRSEEQIEDPEIAEMYEAMQLMAESMAHKHRVSVDLVWESFEALDDHMLYETAAWRRKEGKSAKGGLNAKGVASYRRENPGSKLQTAVTTKPSKLKPGSKAAKRRKSFCARMSGVKGPAKKPNGKPTRKTLALRKWNC